MQFSMNTDIVMYVVEPSNISFPYYLSVLECMRWPLEDVYPLPPRSIKVSLQIFRHITGQNPKSIQELHAPPFPTPQRGKCCN